MVGCLAILLAWPVRFLVSPPDVASNLKERGTVVFDDEGAQAGAEQAAWVMAFLFGSLTLVFGWRAIKPAGKTAQPDDS